MSARREGEGEEAGSGKVTATGKDVKVSIFAQLQAFRRDKTHLPENRNQKRIQPALPQPAPVQVINSGASFPSNSAVAVPAKPESSEHVEDSGVVPAGGAPIVNKDEEPCPSEETDYAGGVESGNVNNVIRPIDRGVVHQICSGQVIVTLSTAVKELVENCLDAGATKIDIRLIEHGSKLIEVSDDGSGIEEMNLEGLALKHHTSKIAEFEDIQSLSTFGFRGEALSSLCALSNLTVTTRYKQSEQKTGYKIEYDNDGRISSKTRCAREHGTTISLKELFHTLPVRHKEFLKNLKSQFNRMVNILYGYCLVVNSVRITCTNQVNNGGATRVFAVPAYHTMKERIVALFGSKQFTSLIEITQPEEVPEDILIEFGLNSESYSRKYTLEGYISQPNLGRSSNDRQFYFINSRPCDSAKMSRVINEIYHRFSRHQSPFVCLHIRTNRENVDVNVTPDKRTLYVQNEKILLATLKAALVPLLTSAASSFSPAESLSQSQLNFTGQIMDSQSERDNTLCHSNSFEIDHTLENQSAHQENSKMGFDRQYSTAGASSLSRSVISKTNAFIERINRGSSELASSSVRNQHDTTDTGYKRPRSFEGSRASEVSKQPKLSGILKKYSASGKESIKGKTEQQYMDLTSDSESMEVEEGEEGPVYESGKRDSRHKSENAEDVEVIVYDDDDDCSGGASGSSTSSQSVSVKVNWKEVANFCSKQRNQNVSSTTNFASRFRAKINPEDNKTAEDELKKQLSKDMFCQMEILGQFNLGFIIVRNGPDLFIVDQHASDEKYNYEDLEKTTVLQGQLLIRPLDLELPAISENIIIDNVKAFQRNGFDFIISPDEEPTKRVKLSKIPYSKNTQFDKSDLEELVFMMEDASVDSFYRPTKVRQMFASRACRKSVMIGTALSPKEMRIIVNHMGEMEQPWNCPHGRPTIRHLINLNLLPDLDNIKFNH